MGFLAGAVVGAGLGAAADKYFASEPGKKTAETAKKMLADFYDFVSPQIKMVKRISRAKYKQIIISAAEEYGRIKKISENAVEELIEKTFAMWEDFPEKSAV